MWGKQEIAAYVFVDIGAFDGDSISEFLKSVNGKYRKIIAFEPDKKNCSEIKAKFKSYENVLLLEYGCYSENKKVTFENDSDNREGAHITDNLSSESLVEVVRIDDVLNEKITYLKMDIEGSELEALRGEFRA